MDGILSVNKTSGETSFAVVAAVRRLLKERRVGHGGTLDPLATGVLPICVGKATRVTQYLLDHDKKYRAEIRFGMISDSGDEDGTITQGGDTSAISEASLESVLKCFVGQVKQTPPMFSALKHNGRPLYELARAGITIERPERTVEIHSLDLVLWKNAAATVDVVCSRGTYIRTLAQDLGKALSCGAYLAGLCRTAYGPFRLENSVTFSQLQQAVRNGDWSHLVHPIDSVLEHLPRLVVPDNIAESVRHGRPFPAKEMTTEIERATDASEHVRGRAYTLDGAFLGVLLFNSEKDEWQPEKVFL